MILANYSYINQLCGHNMGGIQNPVRVIRGDTMRGWYGQRQNDGNQSQIKCDNFSTGAYPPYSYILSDSGGLISATTTVNGSCTFTNLNLAGGLNAASDLTGVGTISQANITAIASVISALSGTGTLTASITGKLEAASALLGQGDITAALGALSGAVADLIGTSTVTADGILAIQASATLSGTGTLTFSSDIIGILQAASNLAGSSSIAADIIGAWFMTSGLTSTSTLTAQITALANLVSALNGSGILNGSVISTGDMSANITVSVSDPLSPESLAAALWNSLAALYNTPGTMGNLINSAGGAADPWSTSLPGAYGAGTAGDLIGNMVDNVWDESKLTHVTPDSMGKILQDLETLIKQTKALTAANL